MSGKVTFKWAWRYGILCVEDFTTLNDAIDAAIIAADRGDEMLDCFEVWDDHGHRVIDRQESARLMEERDRTLRPARPPHAAIVRLIGPDGGTAAYRGYPSLEQAEAAADLLRRLLGADRVKVDPA